MNRIIERRDDMRMVADGSDLPPGGYHIRNEFRTIIIRRRKKAEGESGEIGNVE